MKTYDKICPLLKSDLPLETVCKGSKCAFAHPKEKSTVNEDGNIRYEKDGWYCLVRDFLISMANRE